MISIVHVVELSDPFVLVASAPADVVRFTFYLLDRFDAVFYFRRSIDLPLYLGEQV